MKKLKVFSLIVAITFVGISWSFLILKQFHQNLWDIEIFHLYENYEVNAKSCNAKDIKLSEHSSHLNGLKKARADSYINLINLAKRCDRNNRKIDQSYSLLDRFNDWIMHVFGQDGTISDDYQSLSQISLNDDIFVVPILTQLPGKHSLVSELNHSLDHFIEISKMVDLNRVPPGIDPSSYITGDVMSISDFVHDAIAVGKEEELKELRTHVIILVFIFLLLSLYFAYLFYYKNINIKILWIFLGLNIWFLLVHYMY